MSAGSTLVSQNASRRTPWLVVCGRIVCGQMKRRASWVDVVRSLDYLRSFWHTTNYLHATMTESLHLNANDVCVLVKSDAARRECGM